MGRKDEITMGQKPRRVNLDMTMREAGVLHSILAIVESGDVQAIRDRKIRVGRLLTKLNEAMDVSLCDVPPREED